MVIEYVNIYRSNSSGIILVALSYIDSTISLPFICVVSECVQFIHDIIRH